MISNLSGRQIEILHALKAKALTLDDIAQSLSISRTATQKHLYKLLTKNLVKTTEQEKTAGRSKHLYCLTDEGRELFPRRYSWFTDNFLTTIKQVVGEEQLLQVLENLAKSIAKDNQHITLYENFDERLKQIVLLMNDIGYEAEMNTDTEETQSTELVAHNCVYHHLADNHPEICQFDIALIGNLSGQNVEQTECMVRGGQSCRFKISKPPVTTESTN